MGSREPYEAPWLAKLFHSFPHVDLTFQTINSTFSPYNARYREALVFWAALPVLWLLVTLLIFLMYFCYRCCQKEPDKKRKGSCLPWAMAILALLTCGAIGVGFYGNEDAHKGVLQFASSTEEADQTIHNMQRQVNDLQKNINETIGTRLKELKSFFRNNNQLNHTMQQELSRRAKQAHAHTTEILNHVRTINNKAEKVDLSHAVLNTRTWGYWRWFGTILLLCWEVLLCLLLLFGIGRSSKCTLLVFCAFGIFTLVLCWVAAGLHLGASVGLGDFCSAPDKYVEKVGYETMDKDIVHYYVKCNKQVVNPFGVSLRKALEAVTSANNTLNQAGQVATRILRQPQNEEVSHMNRLISGVSKALDATVSNLQQLTALVECTNLHKDYKQAVSGICSLALPGIVFLLLSAAVTGLLLTILVLLASCAWRHFGRSAQVERKENTEVKGYYEIDEDDPFLPRADNTSPSYYRYGSLPSRPRSSHEEPPFTRGRHTNPREHVPMQRRSSPPPAFDAGTLRSHASQDNMELTITLPRSPQQEEVSQDETDDTDPLDQVEPPEQFVPPPYSTNEFYRQYNDTNQMTDNRHNMSGDSHA